MANEIRGKIHAILPTETFSGRNGEFSKRMLVLDCARFDSETGQRYENYPSLEFFGTNCARLDDFNIGDTVRVEFSLRGRQYVNQAGETKYFTSILAYSITDEDSSVQQSTTSPVYGTASESPASVANVADNLPF